MSERFVFGVPLIARTACRDWRVVDALLALTLRSVLAQGEGDFALVLAGHEPPPCWALTRDDPRFTWLAVDWPAASPDTANNDGGRKKALIKAWLARAGGGLMMFLDADDWVDRAMVGAARRAIGPDMVGGLVAEGWAVDAASGRAAAFPVAGGWDGAFHGLCGSSTVARVRPNGARVIDRDPHAALGSHGDWAANAAAGGHRLAMLDARGAYLVGTGQSHSEDRGPHAEWRRGFCETVRRVGAPLDATILARFGLAIADFAGLRAALSPLC